MDAIKRFYSEINKNLELVSLDFEAPDGPTIPRKEIYLRNSVTVVSLAFNFWVAYLYTQFVRRAKADINSITKPGRIMMLFPISLASIVGTFYYNSQAA